MPSKEVYHGYIKLGICPSCRQNMLFGDERHCPECQAKDYEYQMSRDKEKRYEINRRWQKKTYYGCIENGICTRCRKRKADGNKKMCSICRAKINKRRQEKNYGKPDRKDRCKFGICYFCDNPIKEGYKLCEYHYNKNVEYANLDKTKEARKDLLKQGILY